ncbi:MAG: hypothetical protein KAY91_01595 [Rhodocyclaceae bacterium]|nr:hypothetical protein [Rhodocyclaceae bacterium]
MQPVQLQQGPQATGQDRVALSTTGDFNGSRTAWILDTIHKVFRIFKSPSKGYGIAAKLGEAKMDFNGHGGLVVGVYGVAEGTGQTTAQGVNDVVGVHGTAHKATNCWAAGVHADVYDYAPGGIGIGVNVEFPLTQEGSRYIGVNMQPNTNGVYEGVNLQGHVSTALNTAGGSVDCLLALQSGSPMWSGSGDLGGGLGQHVGKLKIIIDGQAFFLPVYK